MGIVSSEEGFDPQSERFGSYSLSADVSESETSSSSSCRRYDAEGASSSISSSLLAPRVVTGNSIFPAASSLMLHVIGGKDVVVWEEKPVKPQTDLSEVEMMKERFAKLLLGEDMSGGGKGVCTALAIFSFHLIVSDPNAEVIALSPKTLMAANRFVCEICSKGFQRDQNLQLHRRGHNLPWKLRQRTRVI